MTFPNLMEKFLLHILSLYNFHLPLESTFDVYRLNVGF